VDKYLNHNHYYCSYISLSFDCGIRVEERLRNAVENLGGDSGGDSMAANGRKTSDLANLEDLNALAKVLTNHGFFKGKVGGGGQIRTVDAADMSRVL
jgi:hypothetical protein